jgi:energy-coupling factor transporter ATP-binding protein EcfA2
VSVIRVEDLVFRYPDGTPALDGVTLEIARGEFVAFIGQNGSGKTTLSKCLAGLLRPTRGRVIVDGIDTGAKGVMKDLVRRIGYVFQNPDHQLFNSRVYDEISYGPKNLGVPEAERDAIVREVAAATGVREEFFAEHPFFLSKGLRQRVAIASTLAVRPQVIVVDEPTTGQDYRQSMDVMDFLARLRRQGGHTIIIVTHEMPIVAAYAERVIALRKGQVLMDGSTREVFSRPDLLAETFVKPPQATRLAHAWSALGIRPGVLTAGDLVAEIERAVAVQGGIAAACESGRRSAQEVRRATADG